MCNCGEEFEEGFTIQLDDQYRDGGIRNGIDIDEETMKSAEENDDAVRDYLREKGSAAYHKWYKTTTPEERAWILNQEKKLNKKN